MDVNWVRGRHVFAVKVSGAEEVRKIGRVKEEGDDEHTRW